MAEMLMNRQIKPVGEAPSRMSVMIWGPAGFGKTTLASTFPGKKLLINFDPDGYMSITGADDVSIVDFSDLDSAAINTLKDQKDPLKLSALIADYDTIIFDSVTNVAHKTLQHAISITPKATFEFPGIPAYSVRNSYMLAFIKNLLILTAKHNKHAVFIAHEGAPNTNDDGTINYITIALSGDMPNRAAIDFSEVWYLMDDGKKKKIMIRPGRNRRPMKTRMFKTTEAVEFVWTFNPETREGMYVSDWYQSWLDNGKKKISLPT